MIVENWSEFQLFYHVYKYNITSSTTANVSRNILCPFHINTLNQIKKNKHIYFQYIWCDLLVGLIREKLFYNKMKYFIPKQYIKKEHQMIFYIYHYIFNKILMVNRNIRINVDRFINNLNSKRFIGIQIRVGNADLNEKQYTNSYDINLMMKIACKNEKYKKWFLTGDSYKLKINLCRMYDRIIIYSKNKTLHYASHKKDSSVIIEHEILSRSKLLIISQSTYGLVALLKSGLLLQDKENISYEIKKGRVYDMKENFKNITTLWYM